MSVFASIDLGTNTVRLLVVTGNSKGFTTLHSNQLITRLGEGLSHSGILKDIAMERTIKAVLDFKREASKYSPFAIWVAATSAVREAKNRNEFIEKIREVTGLELEVIPCEEEARRTLLGVFSGLDGNIKKAIIFDIGGGSTEYIFTEDKKLVNSVGTDLGVVHLSEKYIKSDPVDNEELRVLENVIADKIKNVRDRMHSSLITRHSSLLIGTAGTVTTIAALDLNLYPYDPAKVNGYVLNIENVKEILNRLKNMPLEERRNIPALESGREDLIIPGAVIVIKTMEIFGFNEMIVSDYGLSYDVNQGETLGLVGESGCGKTVSALSILRLIQEPPGRITGGEILFEGKDLIGLSNEEMRNIRGNRISMIFQEPMTALNPVFTIGNQISEVFRVHKQLGRKESMERSVEMMRLAGIPVPEKIAYYYPHQLSGGMRQRVMIAMALACNPKLLIADEPTTALDVTIQAQIIDLMIKLKEEFGSAVILITHDLGVIAETAKNVVIMYAGKIVERADVKAIFENPLHPYTQGLLRSVLRVDKAAKEHKEKKRLQEIPGIVPSLYDLPKGCYFHPS